MCDGMVPSHLVWTGAAAAMWLLLPVPYFTGADPVTPMPDSERVNSTPSSDAPFLMPSVCE